MCFDDEPAAFREYARAMPNNCVFLVDTYDTLEGVRRAVAVGRELRRQGHELIGVRLDSGDLTLLSRQARQILDKGGFPQAAIFATNDLDEHQIASLKAQGAVVGVWGVGTRLVTGFDEPALGGVYKLSAIRKPGGPWQGKLKLSEQTAKISTPGVLQVRRYRTGSGRAIADAIFDQEHQIVAGPKLVDPLEPARRMAITDAATAEDLLVPVFRDGRRVYQPPSLVEIRRRTQLQLALLHGGVKRLVKPQRYFVGLEQGLDQRRRRLIRAARHRSE
jgi:nicotinate phosphoribosyltransferase